MKLSIQATDADVMCLQIEGKMTQADFLPGIDVLIQVAGEGIYARRVLFDLSRCEYLDSAGLGWLVACHKRFKTQGGRLVLHSLPPLAIHMLKMLKLDQVFSLAGNAVSARQLAMEEKKP